MARAGKWAVFGRIMVLAVAEETTEIVEKEKKPTGRPPVDLRKKGITLADPRIAEEFGYRGWSIRSMARLFNIDKDTLYARKNPNSPYYDEAFALAYERGKEFRRGDLRDAQWKAAMGGNPTMLIWLGKNELGQADRKEIKQTSRQEITLEAVLDALQNAKQPRPPVICDGKQEKLIEEKTVTYGSNDNEEEWEDDEIEN